MSWLIPSVVATFSGTLILVIVYGYLCNQDEKMYVKMWCVGWLFYLLRFIFTLVIIFAGSSPISLAGEQLCSLFSGLLLLYGTYLFSEKKITQWWHIFTAISAIWIIISAFLQLSFVVTTLPSFTFLAFVFIWTGLAFIQYKEIQSKIPVLTGWIFILWGIHKIDYPFLRNVDWFAPWGFLLGAVFEFGIAFGILLVYFQKNREGYINSERRFRNLIESMDDIVFIIDPSQRYVELFGRWMENIGISPDDLRGKTIHEVMDFANSPLHEDAAQRALSGENVIYEWVLDLPGKEAQYYQTSLTPICGNDRQVVQVLGVGRNVTRLKQTENSLLMIQHLADLGTLAAGIAHDIKSPLQIITGISESLIKRIRRTNDLSQEPILYELDMIRRNGWRINEVISSMLTYARHNEAELNNHSLNEIIQDSLLLIQHQLLTWNNIDVQLKLGEHLPDIPCNQNQVTQVLINLVTNAKDAMPDGGVITIRTSYLPLEEKVLLEVQDTGFGIPEDVRAKIFTPFFTTKPAGQGTGLGLTIVQNIVNKHHGEIYCESLLRKGTIFMVKFTVRLE